MTENTNATTSVLSATEYETYNKVAKTIGKITDNRWANIMRKIYMKRKGSFWALLFLSFMLMPFTNAQAQSFYAGTNLTCKPVTVRINRVRQIDDLDSRSRADFKGAITIGGERMSLPTIRSRDEITPESLWHFTRSVCHCSVVEIKIELTEADRGRNDRVDINPRRGVKYLTFTYNLDTRQITGDVSGMRGREIHAAGAGDSKRAEIWFIVE
jgi:hypothetical protein